MIGLLATQVAVKDQMNGLRVTVVSGVALSLLAGCVSRQHGSGDELPIPPHAVVGVQEGQLDADFWISRAPSASRIVLDAQAIAEQNQKLHQLDPSVRDIAGLPAILTRSGVKGWIEELSARPEGPLFDDAGRELSPGTLDDLMSSLALEAIPETRATRYGLVVRRADVRTFPTRMRVFNTRGDTDIDRFQESALFPGTPVAIVHESRDGKWWFVVSPFYSAWLDKSLVAEGSVAQVLGYQQRTPYLIVTGPTVKTVHTPEEPEVSELQLDMGVRVPVLADWPQSKPVNGQHPYTAHVIELPVRAEDGSLRFAPALLPKTADTSPDYLPLNQSNLLKQGFKFLGERYGWGHSYNARDCSGFVSEVYRSFGVQLPRNTRDQAVSPALNRTVFTEEDDPESRLAVLETLHVGDLIYIPGHVMMVIGHENGMPYIIHDTTGITYRNASGEAKRVVLNGVSVTPITPLLLREDQPMINRITSILRMRP